MYSKIEDKARAMAAKAKPASLTINGEIYTFEFCQREWVYKVYKGGFWLVNFNCKTAQKAKQYLREWLDN